MLIEMCDKTSKSDLQSDSGACTNSNPKPMLSFCQYQDVPSLYYPDVYVLCLKKTECLASLTIAGYAIATLLTTRTVTSLCIPVSRSCTSLQLRVLHLRAREAGDNPEIRRGVKPLHHVNCTIPPKFQESVGHAYFTQNWIRGRFDFPSHS